LPTAVQPHVDPIGAPMVTETGVLRGGVRAELHDGHARVGATMAGIGHDGESRATA
jgi:hypothetical protein